MSVRQAGKHELVAPQRGRQLRSGRGEKSQILDEFVAATGDHRKRAVRLLQESPPPPRAGHESTPA